MMLLFLYTHSFDKSIPLCTYRRVHNFVNIYIVEGYIFYLDKEKLLRAIQSSIAILFFRFLPRSVILSSLLLIFTRGNVTVFAWQKSE